MISVHSDNLAKNNYPDWQLLYSNIQKFSTNKIPDIAREAVSANSVIIRDMYVDFGDVEKKLEAWQAQGVDTLLIYADVVCIPAKYISGELKDIFLQIATRRIEVGVDAIVSLDYRDSDAATLQIYTNEMVGSLEVVTESTQQSMTYEISFSEFEAKGVEISCNHGKTTQEFIDSMEELWQWKSSDFKLSLVSIFQFATLFSHSHPDIALSMLEWVKSSTTDSEDTIELFLQSSSLMAIIQASYGDATFVPFLSKDVYAQQTKTFIKAAKAYEQQYQRLIDKNEFIDARKEEAELRHLHHQDTTNFVDKLIQQSQSNLEQAENAVRITKNKLESQAHKVKLAEIDFKTGLEIYKYKQKRDAAFQIISGIFTFATSIVAIVATGGASAPTTGVAVGETVKKASELGESMKKLKDVMEALDKAYKSGQQILTAVENIENAEVLVKQVNQIDTSMPKQGKDLSGAEYWSELKLKVNRQLEEPITLGIAGAREYQLAFDILALYGQSLAAKKCDVIRIGQELARLKLQKQVSGKQQQRLWKYLQELSAKQKPNTEMMQVLYQRYLNIKRSLFIAIENYRWAYNFWALQDSKVRPSMVKNVEDLEEDLSKIVSDYGKALDRFKPKTPNDFEDKTCEMTLNSEASKSFQKTGEIIFPIPLDYPEFTHYDRVRIREIRVWLEGARPKVPQKSIYVKITTSGAEYSDRYKEQTYRFAGQPIDRLFEYRLLDDPQGTTIPSDWVDWRFDDGKIGDAKGTSKITDTLQYAYFEPPVFSDWKISVSTEKVDLSKVSKITIEFEGNYISR